MSNLSRPLDSNELLYIESPNQMAAWHYREDTFRNPYIEGSNNWIDYEAERAKILAHEEKSSRY